MSKFGSTLILATLLVIVLVSVSTAHCKQEKKKAPSKGENSQCGEPDSKKTSTHPAPAKHHQPPQKGHRSQRVHFPRSKPHVHFPRKHISRHSATPRQHTSKPTMKSTRSHDNQRIDHNRIILSLPPRSLGTLSNTLPSRISSNRKIAYLASISTPNVLDKTANKLPRPPKTVNEPRKIEYMKFKGEKILQPRRPEKVISGSDLDKKLSQWFVADYKQGYEYEGDPAELEKIFKLAKLKNLPETSDELSIKGLPQMSYNQRFGDPSKPDSRVKINPPHDFPYSAIVRIVYDDDETDLICSGAFISPTHILTAAHCLYNATLQKYYEPPKLIERIRDCNSGLSETYTMKTSMVTRGSHDPVFFYEYDFGVIVVEEESPKWLNFGWATSEMLPIKDVHLLGYPGDLPGQCMWESKCLLEESELVYWHTCDMWFGSSGGPMYKYNALINKATVYCVQSFALETDEDVPVWISNVCARITKYRFGLIQYWLANY